VLLLSLLDIIRLDDHPTPSGCTGPGSCADAGTGLLVFGLLCAAVVVYFLWFTRRAS
jgi:hypothetical protein